MKLPLFVVSLFLAVPLAAGAEGLSQHSPETVGEPKAAPESIVTAGNARFTVLTPQMIRMEWSGDGVFEDRASLPIINRRLPVPEFKIRRAHGRLVLQTEALKLTYRGNGSFSEDNLEVEFTTAGRRSVWRPGMSPDGNLMGTARTLDEADGRHLPKDSLELGLLSRDGWSVIDDSRSYLFDESGWVTPRRPGNRQDLYLFAYGHEYRRAMGDWSKVSGAAPLPPRYVFGYWWSRYWQYSDSELRDIVARLRSIDIPVDVLIIDMDWHETWGLSNNPEKDEFGQNKGWTGYTWQKELFPSPENMFEWAHRAGLKTALNLHPASGIQPYEEPYERFCKAYGWERPGEPVPFRIDERKWADAYYETVLEPIERQGNDFWWLDWQQWKTSLWNEGLSNTFWLNHVFFNYAREHHPELRPFIYHRWGGLGSHRYPLGFSGDTIITWESLEYQPEFTATSANVNYGYWGHDLGGHMFHRHQGTTNPERYTRWLQYGVFSPLYKIHPTKHPSILRYPWLFPDYMFQMVEAFRLRYALIPYIYNAARRNYDTGIAMCYPLYYNHPEAEEAYTFRSEFMFGDDILATCVASPSDSVSALAKIDMWFPEGDDWFDMATGTMYRGGTKSSPEYTIDENPWYARAGSIIPMNPSSVRSLQRGCDTLVLTAVPGADGELVYYEDDGVSRKYDTDYALTRVSQTRTENCVTLKIAPREGSYDGMGGSRSFELRFPCTRTPSMVTVNGAEIARSRFPETGKWTYEAYRLCPTVYLKDMPSDMEVVVQLTLPEGRSDAELYGLQKTFLRCRNISEEYKNEQGMADRKLMLPIEYLKVSQCPNFIMEDPENLFVYIDEMRKNMIAYREYLEGDNPLISERMRMKLRKQITE